MDKAWEYGIGQNKIQNSNNNCGLILFNTTKLDLWHIDSWGFVVWDFKKTNWRYCIAELTFIFGECNKASDNIWTFPRVQVPHTYIGEKTTTWFTCAPVLPCCLCTETMEWNRNGAWLTLQRLPIFTKYKLWRKKLSRGQNGRVSQVSRNKTIFFLGLKRTVTKEVHCKWVEKMKN